MATNLLPFRPTGICASAASSSTDRRRPDPSRRSPPSTTTAGWWTPLFGWSSEPDYIDTGKAVSSGQAGSGAETNDRSGGARFSPGCFTEEKAKQLRMMTKGTASFHDAMYHSAIASRLASDFGSATPDA